MLLGDLLADPDLGLVLLTGEQHLDRPVHGCYITDLLDPRRYLHGGELVLSGLVWRNKPGDADRFVSALAAADIAALAAGTALLGDAPQDLIEACRRHGVPALQVPLAVSFNTLARRVQQEQHSGPTSRRELVAAVASGADLADVLSMAAAELGDGCWALSAAGWVPGGVEELSEGRRRELVRAFLESVDSPDFARMPTTSRFDAESFVLLPVEAGTELPAARWFVVVRGDQRRWTSEQEAVAADLGTAVALLRARTDQARQIAGRSVEATLARSLDATVSPPELAARLETAGLSPTDSLRVVSMTVGDDVASATALLRELAASTGTPSVTVTLRGRSCALFFADDAELSELDDELRRAASGIEPGLGTLPVRIGLSDTSAATGLRGALEEASHARRLAGQSPGSVSIVSGAQLASHQVLLASVPDELRNSYRERVLAKLVDYDREHHSDLIRTLRVFLEYSGSWSRCARHLHVHVNTLRYRIQRITEITGRDLADFGVRVDFYLALELNQERLRR